MDRSVRRDRFFGRERELATLRRLFDAGERLVTLLGPGGVGKTTLALRWAADERASATVFCDLTDARTADAVVAAVARAVGVDLGRDAARADAAVARVGRALAQRRAALVVLDNCEQAIGAIAEAVGAWHGAAPAVRWLATSREPLRLSAERICPVPPLSLPGSQGGVGEESEAVQLFVECMRRRLPDLALDADQRRLVGEVVCRLEGLPLAIELAAARAAQLGIRTVLDALDRPLEMLATGPRDAAARHRTMRATVAWSWDLLAPWERSALAQCAVFRGAFGVEAARDVVDLGDIAGAPALLEALDALVDKSMLRPFEAPPGAGGWPRTRPYDVVRAFVEEQPETKAAADGARARHRARYGALARRWLAEPGPADPRALDLERAELVAAHGEAIDAGPGAASDACALMLVLAPVLEGRETAAAYLARLDATLAVASASPLALGVRIARAEARATSGALEGAADDAATALALAKDRGDRAAESRAQAAAGLVAWHGGDLAGAARALDEAASVAEGAGAAAAELWARRRAANLALDSHRLDDAARELEIARALAQRLGDRRAEALLSGTSALVHHRSGANERARADATEALRLFEEARDVPRAAITLSNLGVIAQELGRWDEARGRLDEALDAAGRAGDQRLMGFVLGCMGRVEHETAHADLAVERYTEALRHLDEVGAGRLGVLFRAALGAAAAELGRAEEALRELAAAARAAPPADAHLEALVRAYRSFARSFVGDAGAEPSPGDDGGTSALAARDEDLRIALRLAPNRGTRRVPPAPVDPDALVVATDGRWFRAPGGEPVLLAKRRNLRRVLVALSRARIDGPGRPVSADGLLAAGWPGEKMAQRAATMRVYATLSRLRKLGLGDYLVSRPDGWLLDGRLPLHFSEGEP